MWRERAFQTVWEVESWGGVADNHSFLLGGVKSIRKRKIKGGLNLRREQRGCGYACRRHGQKEMKNCSCSASPLNREHAHQGWSWVGQMRGLGAKGWQCLPRKKRPAHGPHFLGTHSLASALRVGLRKGKLTRKELWRVCKHCWQYVPSLNDSWFGKIYSFQYFIIGNTFFTCGVCCDIIQPCIKSLVSRKRVYNPLYMLLGLVCWYSPECVCISVLKRYWSVFVFLWCPCLFFGIGW